MRKTLLGTLTGMLALIWSCGAETVLQLPPLKTPPTIDGAIQAEEWKGAGFFCGFQWSGTADPREGWAWLGYDNANLYFAVRNEMPPDGKQLHLSTNLFTFPPC